MLNLFFDYIAVAAAAGAAGAIALLLAGTQVLDWYWPVALFVAGLVAGAIHARKFLRTDYQLAQMIDRKLSLADRVSTVVFFRRVLGQAPESLRTVEDQALAKLSEQDLADAVPLRIPRSGYACAALLCMAAGLVGVRYGMLRTLDLGQPLARMDFGLFQEPPAVQAVTKKSLIQERFERQLEQLGLDMQDLDAQQQGLSPVEENVEGVSTPGAEPPRAGEKGTPGKNAASEDGTEAPEDGEKGENGSSEGAEDTDSNSPPDANAKQQNAPQGTKPGSNPSQNNSNLMNKMKDALANLMNKLKTPGKEGEPQQSASLAPGQSPGGKQQQNSQKGTQGQGKSQGEGEPGPDQQADEGGDADKTPGNTSKAGDKNSDRPGSQEAKSGMGKQDGEKEIRDAEQLAAMGKISEILGKRAAQVTGEMTVEVSSSKQQLKTAYTDQRALHADTGAEVNRDAIPLMYQSYVQRYFEELRKVEAKTKAVNP